MVSVASWASWSRSLRKRSDQLGLVQELAGDRVRVAGRRVEGVLGHDDVPLPCVALVRWRKRLSVYQGSKRTRAGGRFW